MQPLLPDPPVLEPLELELLPEPDVAPEPDVDVAAPELELLEPELEMPGAAHAASTHNVAAMDP